MYSVGCVCIFIGIYSTITIKGKEAMNLRGTQGWEGEQGSVE